MRRIVEGIVVVVVVVVAVIAVFVSTVLVCMTHLSVSTSLLSGIVSSNDLLLAFIGLREGKTSLLSHSLYLSHLSDGLLELLHSWPVIGNVVLLDLLHVMVGLGIVHSPVVLPQHVSEQADGRQQKGHGPVHNGRISVSQNASVLS